MVVSGLNAFHPHPCHRVRYQQMVDAAQFSELSLIAESFLIYSKQHKGPPLRIKDWGPPLALLCWFPNMQLALQLVSFIFPLHYSSGCHSLLANYHPTGTKHHLQIALWAIKHQHVS